MKGCRFAGLSLLFLAAAASAQSGDFAQRLVQAKRPKLTVVISIDQFRADYLTRLTDLFLPAREGSKVGGFRYLMTQGSYYVDARYDHMPTYTGPGHAVILSGSSPYKNGIAANEWYDRASGSVVYCVDDARQKVVGAGPGSSAKPMGPLNMLSTTVGDELKLATNGTSKVVTLSLKDRAAILLGGHSQDLSIWFDDADGRWISSTAFCPSGKLPAWVETLNSERIPDRTLGTVWNPSLPLAALNRSSVPHLRPTNEPYGMGLTFPHRIGAEKVKKNYRAFTLTPSANGFVFETAKRAIASEKLGQRGAADLLAINLATNDYTGHAFGPYSPEATDVAVQTDRQLSDLLNTIEKTVPGGLKETVVVVTADHGVVPVVEDLEAHDMPGMRVLEGDVAKAAETAIENLLGPGKWVAAYVEPYLTLNDAAIDDAVRSGKASSREAVETVAAQAVDKLAGVYACYTRSQILAGRLPSTDIARHVAFGFHPKVSGDVLVVTDLAAYTDPGTPGPYATSHGTPFVYDTHVPILIAVPGVRKGIWTMPVAPSDIAPTLSILLGIEFPSGCDGHILPSALAPMR